MTTKRFQRSLGLLGLILALLASLPAGGQQEVEVDGAVRIAHRFPPSQIADEAKSRSVGSHGGQCKVWAANVVNTVLARNGISARVGGYGTPGGAYYGAYERAGAHLVAVNDAQPGDVIQTIRAAQRHSDYPTTTGLHTAIVVAHTSTPGTYIVRDSNWNLNERITEHQFSPASWAHSKGAEAYVWRFGAVSGGSQPLVQDHRSLIGSIVQWDGDRNTQRASWLVIGAHGERVYVPDVATYWCLRESGAVDAGAQSAATLDRLPDRWGTHASCGRDTLHAGQILWGPSRLQSSNGRFHFYIQGDGNAVLYDRHAGNRVLWATNRLGGTGSYLAVQGDSNVVVYNRDGSPVWASNTVGRGIRYLVVQNDGNVVGYAGENYTRPVWATNTAR